VVIQSRGLDGDCDKEDLIFDVRKFHDPESTWELRQHDGPHPLILQRLLRHELFDVLMEHLATELVKLLPALEDGDIHVTMMCRAGRHRSIRE